MPTTADRVRETSTTTGTGTFTLAGASVGFRTFTSAFVDGDVVYYVIVMGAEWEVGYGAFTASGTTLARSTVLASSNAGSLVNFSAGTKDVFAAAPASFLLAPRTGSAASAAQPTINTDLVDFYHLTAQAEAITSFTANLSGTPKEAQHLWIAITGTAARAITWGASFEDGAATLPTTTVGTNRLDVGFIRNTVTSKWRCMASG